MATLKYKLPSPYTEGPQNPPPVDYLYAKYQQNVSLEKGDAGSGEPISLALFGAGRAGSIHLGNLVVNPRVKILYIVEDVKQKWEDIKRYWNMKDTEFIHSKDSQKVFKDPRVRAIVVASPTETHESIVRGALSSGKDVFCEKPIAMDRDSSERCYQQAKEAGRVLFCAFNRRFDPAYAMLKRRVRDGVVGQVHTIKVCSRDSPLPSTEYLRTSGGIFHDCAVHDIDIMCWVLGEYPNRVSSVAHAHIPEIAAMDDHDTVAIVLGFPSGTVGMIDLSRNAVYGYDQRLEVFGPKGMVNCSNERPMCGIETHLGQGGCVNEPIYFSFPSRYHLAYVNEMNHFLDVLEGKSKMTVLGHETLAVSKIASACEESARTGNVVSLTWGPQDVPPN